MNDKLSRYYQMPEEQWYKQNSPEPNNYYAAIQLINKLHERFNGYGLTFALYGSTLRQGHGKDIDIYCINAFGIPEPKSKVADFFMQQDYTVVNYSAIDASILFEKEGQRIDMCFMEKVYQGIKNPHWRY